MNLTGARTAAERGRGSGGGRAAGAGRCLSGAADRRRLRATARPGLVLALLRDDLEVTLLEPRARRWAFLREAARRAGPLRGGGAAARHDAYSGPPAATVTAARAALPLAELLPLVRPGGRLIVFGRPAARSRRLSARRLPGRGLGAARSFAPTAAARMFHVERCGGRRFTWNRQGSRPALSSARARAILRAARGVPPWDASSPSPTRRAAWARPRPPSTSRPAWPRRSAGCWPWTPTPRAT